MKSKVALAVAIVLAILAAVGIRAYLRQREQTMQQKVKNVQVLIAAKLIKKGTPVISDMVEVKEVPEFMVMDGRTLLELDLRRVLGQRVTTEVRQGEPLQWGQFTGEGTSDDTTTALTTGYRLVTIPVDKVTGCAGLLLPGSIVDVHVTLRTKGASGATVEPVSMLALPAMRVVATDLNLRTPTFYTIRDRRDFATYSTVTLRATPRQANALIFLSEQGKLHLDIRGPSDETGMDPSQLEKVSTDNLDAILKKAAEDRPAPPPVTTPK